MNAFGLIMRKRPRIAAALLFGTPIMAVTHFAWTRDTRTSGWAPALTFAVGVVHALAGAITGKRLVDMERTKTYFGASVLGAVTSLIAQVLFAPVFSLWVFATNARPESTSSFLAMTVLITLFSFLAIGWAFLLISAAIGCVLYRLAKP